MQCGYHLYHLSFRPTFGHFSAVFPSPAIFELTKVNRQRKERREQSDFSVLLTEGRSDDDLC